MAKLLPALDAFALTRAHMSDGDDASPEVKALLQAAGLVDDALAKEGLERIDDAGAPFDPTVHDAVEHAPAADEASTGNRCCRRRTGGGRGASSGLPLEGPGDPPGHGARARMNDENEMNRYDNDRYEKNNKYNGNDGNEKEVTGGGTA